MKKHYIQILLLLLLTSCFYNKTVDRQEHRIINDLIIYPQNMEYYSNLLDSQDPLISTHEQNEFYISFISKFFRVWHDITEEETEEILKYYQDRIENLYKNPGIGENKLTRTDEFVKEISDIANLSDGFNTMKKGIMLNYSYIRVLPTLKPFFLDFALAGEGYPFDYFQNSTIPIATPIFIYHENQNWALIDSHICSGWVPRNLIAYIDDDTINDIMLAPQVAITKDRTSLFNKNNAYVAHADIGTVFSVAQIHSTPDTYEIFHFTKDEFNYATPANLFIPDNLAQSIPIPLTPNNIATLSNEMMGQVYGWGGLYFNRDCSQSLLDLYIGFGILLPRNGRAQAYEFGEFYNMREIKSVTEKKNEIIKLAKPFMTLVRTPGHIMLYVGNIDGEPLVFHTIWGLRTVNNGRHVIGKTVVTGLEPGKELRNVEAGTTLIYRLEGITHIKP